MSLPDTPPHGSALTRWVPLAVIALVPVAVARISLRAVEDPDAFWHVLGGEHVLRTGSFVGPDPFGQFATLPWVQHEWLGEVVMFGAHRIGGLAGLSVLALVLALGLYGALYVVCRREAGVVSSALVALLAIVGASGSLSIRPQLFSFILLAVALSAWRATSEDLRARWWLIPLTWVWACLHGLWLSGAVLGLGVCLGLLLDGRARGRELGRLLLVPLGSIVAAGLTPIGPRLLAAPLTVNAYADLVTEWDPPDIQQAPVAMTTVLVLGVAVSWLRQDSRVPWTDLAVWTMAFGWMLLYSRTVALAAVLVAPLAASALDRLLRTPRERRRRPEIITLVTACLLTAGVGIAVAPRLEPQPVDMPTALNAELDALPAGTVIFNDDRFGGWLLLEHPELEPVIDSRTEIRTRQYWVDWINARAALPGWERFLSETGARTALIRSRSALRSALEQAQWQVVAERDGFVLLQAP